MEMGIIKIEFYLDYEYMNKKDVLYAGYKLWGH